MPTIKSDRIRRARARLLIKHPFFGSLLTCMPMHETEVLPDGSPLPTAATNMTEIFISPKFVDTIDDDVLEFVFAHEIMHVALEHGIRTQNRNPILWNVAGDFAINLMLEETGFKVWDKALLDKKWEGMNAEHIYDKLQQDADKQRKQSGQSGNGDGDDDPSGQGYGNNPMIGDLVKPDGAGDPAQQAEMQRKVRQMVAQAATTARMAGKLSGALERMVGEILEPQVPWKDMLREYMMKTAADDESWNRRNRRFQNVYLPKRYSERMGEIVCIGDTSGSIGNDELMKYVSEATSIAEDCKPERVRILWADTQVAGEQVFEYGEQIVPKPAGHGGTDMRVPLEHAEQFEPEVVVLFTDGYTPWPTTEPGYPLIVCCTTDVDVPVGTVLRI